MLGCLSDWKVACFITGAGAAHKISIIDESRTIDGFEGLDFGSFCHRVINAEAVGFLHLENT